MLVGIRDICKGLIGSDDELSLRGAVGATLGGLGKPAETAQNCYESAKYVWQHRSEIPSKISSEISNWWNDTTTYEKITTIVEAYAMYRVFASGGAEGETVTLESEAAGVTGEAGEAGGMVGSEGVATVEGAAEEAAGAIEEAAGKGKIRIQSGNATIGLSQTKIEHVFKNHTLGRMKETIDHLMEKGLKETAENLLNEKSFFNPKWSEKKVTEAVNYVYNEAVSKGIKNGKYTTIVSGEKITVCFQNGSFHTAFGKYKFLLSDFGY